MPKTSHDDRQRRIDLWADVAATVLGGFSWLFTIGMVGALIMQTS